MKTKIFIAYHKPDTFYENNVFEPIHVGKDLSKYEMNIIGDNTGDNISTKNKNYCELTALYWIWKNVKDLDYIGLMHYRRFFTNNRFNKILKLKKIKFNILNFINNIINMKQVYGYLPDCTIKSRKLLKKELDEYSKQINNIAKYDVILPEKSYFSTSIEKQYSIYHSEKDFYILDKCIKNLYPENYLYFKKYKKVNYSYNYNMFIMKYKFFDMYMNFLFSILSEVEKNIKISTDPYQARVFGFMSERLMLPFIEFLKEKYHINIREDSVIFYK